jgi:hypothetical protein
MSIKTIAAVALLVMPLAAQEQGRCSTCKVHYENHNQIDYGPLVVQDVKATITDPQQVAVPKVCAGIFTEKDHNWPSSYLHIQRSCSVILRVFVVD